MATESRQLLSRPERQETILRGAAHAFAQSGYAATSMEDVAAASGITKLIVYRHFESKEELYRAVLKRVADRLTEVFLAGLSRADRRGLGVQTLLTVAREDPEAFILLWRHASREPQFESYAGEQRERSVHAASTLLGPSIPDPMIHRWAAETIVSYLVEAVLHWLDDGDAARDDEFVERVTDGLHAMHQAWSHQGR
jgi:AcrR family transcriptional regulator